MDDAIQLVHLPCVVIISVVVIISSVVIISAVVNSPGDRDEVVVLVVVCPAVHNNLITAIVVQS